MSQAVITVANVSKSFVIAHEGKERYTSLRDVVTQKAKSLFSFSSGGGKSKAKAYEEEFWALKDVSFEIHPGDRVGIIGRNGAGKSTLLKILSRITEPTQGRIDITGRVASLLEVGTGFHPELTGSENIFLNGAILGMSRAEIRKKFDEIVAFAEVEQFLDTPVKRYSSGMYVRLAFAVAAHLEPEILIVDEVLAVGDAAFQKKCLGKMEDVSKNLGRTVLFVSHNMGLIAQLCQRAILLNKGRIELSGDVRDVIQGYLHDSQSTSTNRFINSKINESSIIFRRVSLMDTFGNFRGNFSNDEVIVIQAELATPIIDKELKIGITLQSKTGDYLSTFIEETGHFEMKNNLIQCRFSINVKNISPNSYFFRVAAFSESTVYDIHEMICSFIITDTGTEMAKYQGISYGYFNMDYNILKNDH